MDEKMMVNDTLTGINGELVRYGEMISQTENPQLKQTLKQMRNQCEMSQEEIYQIARGTGLPGICGSCAQCPDSGLCKVR